MFNSCRVGLKKALLVFSGCLLAIASHQSLAAGPAKIKWIKTCGRESWQHMTWVIGLSNGVNIWGVYNPGEGRSATFSLIQSAQVAGQNVYWENAVATTAVVCGVATNFQLDPNYTNSASFQVGDP